MSFITKAELKSASVIAVVNKAINNDDTVVDIIIDETEDVMRSYLSGRFDVDAIFNAEDTDRSGVVVKHFKKIVIHEIYKRKTGEVNEITQADYDEAMTWLEGVSSGRIDAGNLPPAEDEAAEGDGFIKFGGNTRYSSNF